MLTIIIGIASSIVAEAITWGNKRLSGTVLQGDAAFILASAVALAGAAIEIYVVPTATYQVFLTHWAQIWAVSQVWFLGVIQLFGLNVQPTTTTSALG